MSSDLAAFLSQHTPHSNEGVVWGDHLSLAINCYLSAEQPPLDYVTSVRCLVFRGDSILVMRNIDETHIIPGGRREDGETLEETLHREVLEETGWSIIDASMLGFIHFHHLGPKPPNHPYHYPDFIQLVYTASALAFSPNSMIADDYEFEAHFRPITEARTVVLSPCQQLYLGAAIEIKEGGPQWTT